MIWSLSLSLKPVFIMFISEKSTNKHLGLETQHSDFNEKSFHWTQHASSFLYKLAAKLQSEVEMSINSERAWWQIYGLFFSGKWPCLVDSLSNKRSHPTIQLQANFLLKEYCMWNRGGWSYWKYRESTKQFVSA